MSDSDDDSADGERGLFARVLRRSADELEQPDDGDDADVEERADDEDDDDDEMDEAEQDASPIDTALENGTIEAAQAATLRDVAEKMDDNGVKMLVDAISENDLDVNEAVEMIEAYNGGGDMADPDGDDEAEAPGELKARLEDLESRLEDDNDAADAGGLDDDEVAELRSRLETLDALADVPDRLDDLEARLDDTPSEEDVEAEVEQRLEAVGEELDEQFDDLFQRAEVVGSPQPTTGDGGGSTTLGDSLPVAGGGD